MPEPDSIKSVLESALAGGVAIGAAVAGFFKVTPRRRTRAQTDTALTNNIDDFQRLQGLYEQLHAEQQKVTANQQKMMLNQEREFQACREQNERCERERAALASRVSSMEAFVRSLKVALPAELDRRHGQRKGAQHRGQGEG